MSETLTITFSIDCPFMSNVRTVEITAQTLDDLMDVLPAGNGLCAVASKLIQDEINKRKEEGSNKEQGESNE